MLAAKLSIMGFNHTLIRWIHNILLRDNSVLTLKGCSHQLSVLTLGYHKAAFSLLCCSHCILMAVLVTRMRVH